MNKMDLLQSEELNKHKQRFKTLFNLTGEAVLVCRDENIVDGLSSFIIISLLLTLLLTYYYHYCYHSQFNF